MNDPTTLHFYTAMQVFQNNERAGTGLQFPPTLSPSQKQLVVALAVKLNLDFTFDSDGSITVNGRTENIGQHKVKGNGDSS